MYKESMIDGDSNIGNTLHRRSLRRYHDQNLWHNQFCLY